MIEKSQTELSGGLRTRKIASAILALLGIPGYYFCASHICMAGHMQHPPYATWHLVVDFAWASLFAGSAALAILSDLRRRIIFALLLVFLVVSRFCAGSGGGGLFLLELPASIIIVAFAILGLRKRKLILQASNKRIQPTRKLAADPSRRMSNDLKGQPSH